MIWCKKAWSLAKIFIAYNEEALDPVDFNENVRYKTLSIT